MVAYVDCFDSVQEFGVLADSLHALADDSIPDVDRAAFHLEVLLGTVNILDSLASESF